MVVHDEQYNADIARAEEIVQSFRRGNKLGRPLWLIVELLTTGAGILADIKTKVSELHDQPPVNLAPLEEAVARQGRDIQQILAFINGLAEPGQAETLNLTLSTPEDNV